MALSPLFPTRRDPHPASMRSASIVRSTRVRSTPQVETIAELFPIPLLRGRPPAWWRIRDGGARRQRYRSRSSSAVAASSLFFFLIQQFEGAGYRFVSTPLFFSAPVQSGKHRWPRSIASSSRRDSSNGLSLPPFPNPVAQRLRAFVLMVESGLPSLHARQRRQARQRTSPLIVVGRRHASGCRRVGNYEEEMPGQQCATLSSFPPLFFSF